jgi:hypothetical protein
MTHIIVYNLKYYYRHFVNWICCAKWHEVCPLCSEIDAASPMQRCSFLQKAVYIKNAQIDKLQLVSKTGTYSISWMNNYIKLEQ